MRIDLTFAGDYELRIADGSDGSRGLTYGYPPGAPVDASTLVHPEMTITFSVAGSVAESEPMVGPDLVQVDVRPAHAARWSGAFQARLPSPRGASCAVALPDRASFAVVSHGAAYRVWVTHPARWEEISPGGVAQPVVVDAPELVLFVEHTTILAYGSRGLAWKSDPLVSDELEAMRVDGEYLWANGFDAVRNETVPLTVDLRTGRSAFVERASGEDR
jgi:hypothetical protein